MDLGVTGVRSRRPQAPVAIGGLPWPLTPLTAMKNLSCTLRERREGSMRGLGPSLPLVFPEQLLRAGSVHWGAGDKNPSRSWRWEKQTGRNKDQFRQ